MAQSPQSNAVRKTLAGDLRLPALDPLEICSGIVFGERRSPRPAAEPSGDANAREVLEELLLPALESPPCFVGFSGGRDSSALLSLATVLARKHGLVDPVPLAMRFEDYAETDETEWQEMMIDHLGLRRWEILPIRDELHPLGPVATAVLRRHGLYWPPVAHRIVPLLEAARGAVLVIGTGGDEMFSPLRPNPVRPRPIRVRPFRRAVRHALFNLLPREIRSRLWSRRVLRLRWLRPTARRQVQGLYRAKLRHRSPSWGVAVGRLPDTRNYELTQAVFGAMARDAEVSLVQPFCDPRFIHTAGEAAPRRGFPSRSAAMEFHFGDILPRPIIERTTKAGFDELFSGQPIRAFAESWDGGGLDPAGVDAQALRREWLSPRPDYRSLTALNAAWLASRGGEL